MFNKILIDFKSVNSLVGIDNSNDVNYELSKTNTNSLTGIDNFYDLSKTSNCMVDTNNDYSLPFTEIDHVYEYENNFQNDTLTQMVIDQSIDLNEANLNYNNIDLNTNLILSNRDIGYNINDFQYLDNIPINTIQSNNIMADRPIGIEKPNGKGRQINHHCKCNSKSNFNNLQIVEIKKAFFKIDRLKRTVNVYAKKQEEVTLIKKQLYESDVFKNGNLNIEKIICNNKGRISILSEKSDMNRLVINILKKDKLKASNVDIKNPSFCIHNVPALMSKDEVLKEISRDARFNCDNIKIIDVFKFSKSSNTIVFSIGHELLDSIIQKPYVFIKLNKFNLYFFVKLIQCFNCADFGHFGKNCPLPPKCLNCAGDHDKMGCVDFDFVPKCINCFKDDLSPFNHSSWDASCP